MDYSKFYFQYINIPYDQSDIDNLLSKYPLTPSKFEAMDVNELKQLMPSIFSWFENNGLEIDSAFLINHKPGFKQDIHSDYSDRFNPGLAINIPLNPEAAQATTRVYDIIDGQDSYLSHRPENQVVYSKFDPNQVKLITEYKSISPVILNISKPHSAWNNTDSLRGLITFRFKKDPTHLIKE